MKKSKGQTVDLLYNKNKKSQKNNNKTSKKVKKQNENNKIINLDNEIIIGLTPKKEEKMKKNNNSSPSKKKASTVNKSSNSSKTKMKKKKASKKKSIATKFIKWIFLFTLILATIILFLMSSIFNIKEIKVINNAKISKEEIINLSELQIGNNMFKTTKRSVRNNIKTNAYIENVNIKRSFNGIITLDIIERKPTYMLRLENSYVYINNQGYLLEITETPLELPYIIGFSTPEEQIKEGNRLIVEDLKKLDDIIKIMNSANDLALANIITGIDIAELKNYNLFIESENKTVHFGDITNANVKLLRIQEVIEKEKGIAGEIYFQNLEKTVFREKV